MTTKEELLLILNAGSNNKSFVSGEELAQRCKITRAAVHKAVDSLRKQGYLIEAVTNKGYRIEHEPDAIDAKTVQNLIEDSGEKCSVIAFDEIDSTNLEAKRRSADKDIDRVLFIAGRQTAGRGRMGRPFVSPPNSGVYFSLIYRPAGGVRNPAFYTAAAAVAVSRAVKELYDEECKIKWVNDVFLNGKKICGILTEGVSNFETGAIDAAIVGIGINVRNSGFKGELADVAGSIEEIMEAEKKRIPNVSRNQIAAKVISNLLKIYNSYSKDDKKEVSSAMEEYRQRSLLTGLTVTVNPSAGTQGKTYQAKVLGVTDEAELIVETKDGSIKNLFSGEVSLRSSHFSSNF